MIRGRDRSRLESAVRRAAPPLTELTVQNEDGDLLPPFSFRSLKVPSLLENNRHPNAFTPSAIRLLNSADSSNSCIYGLFLKKKNVYVFVCYLLVSSLMSTLLLCTLMWVRVRVNKCSCTQSADLDMSMFVPFVFV